MRCIKQVWFKLSSRKLVIKNGFDIFQNWLIETILYTYCRKGIFANGACYPKCVHWVNIVGYADLDKYWIIRNSWGEDWGMDGYMFLLKDYRVFPTGLCGISQEVVYAEVGVLSDDF